jgi:hypothetical protein
MRLVLGEGGMGRVERVRDGDLLRDVAVKLLRPELLRDARMLRQFLWEARVTAYLDHPNIVPVHDLGRTPRAEGASIARQLGRYYFAHDPAIRRLRVYEIDAWIASAFFLGLGIAALVGARLAAWGWPLLVFGLVAAFPTTVRWIRFRRQLTDRASGRRRELER